MSRPPRSGRLVILGLVWEEDRCLARVAVPGATSKLLPVVGQELNYRPAVGPDGSPLRHCIGHHSPGRNNGAYIDCSNPPQPTERTCVSCAVADATFASNLHHAHTRDRADLDQAVVDHLEQANILYLAGFRDGSVKVGTSTEHRKHRRWLEQGAWHVVEVATVNDGFAVRRLEDLITDKLGLPQSVGVKRKLAGMASPLSEAALGERLNGLVAEVHSLIPLSQDAGAAEITHGQWSFPESAGRLWNGLLQYPARLDTGTHNLRVEAMCGRIAVVSRGADRFVADFGQLYGIELDLGAYEADPLAIQDSLF